MLLTYHLDITITTEVTKVTTHSKHLKDGLEDMELVVVEVAVADTAWGEEVTKVMADTIVLAADTSNMAVT